jgi:hypothetical protein
MFLILKDTSWLKWQGRLDSNQRMPGSKPGALPLGDAPVDVDDHIDSHV